MTLTGVRVGDGRLTVQVPHSTNLLPNPCNQPAGNAPTGVRVGDGRLKVQVDNVVGVVGHVRLVA